MKLYLETTALVKLYVDEVGSSLVRDAAEQATVIATSAIAYVEARAAFVRRRSEGGLSVAAYRRVVDALEADWERYLVLSITNTVIRDGARLAQSHRLRAYDAMHLACASSVRERLAEPCIFASWDQRLELAARREGLDSLRSSR